MRSCKVAHFVGVNKMILDMRRSVAVHLSMLNLRPKGPPISVGHFAILIPEWKCLELSFLFLFLPDWPI